jgi:hypothetical protein
MTSARIAAGILHLSEQVLGAEWGDHLDKAAAAQTESLAAMRDLHAAAVEREALAEKLEAQRIENERMAAELAAERAKIAAERAELDRQAAERAEQSRLIQAEEEKRQATALAAEREQWLRDNPPVVVDQRAVDMPVQDAHAGDDVKRRDAEQLAFVARKGDSPVVPVEPSNKVHWPFPEKAAYGSHDATATAEEIGASLAEGFELPALDLGEDVAPVLDHPEATAAIGTLEAEIESLTDQLEGCRVTLIEATDMLDELIAMHSPKRMAAGYFARVAALRAAGRLPRPTTTTKENT